ncbi:MULTISPECIES: alpha/beta fold hydrolase [Halomonadaceae]|uniref:Alpha/beta fold hydrolase n=1 Tax=Vreelandella halophila TaxID=86177 RepID=A0A9X4YD56_9GAMM|nr:MULTISPECIES: alpha/beta hydrolase [Halomonas]MYL27504.1 alpha/beta fold hydrolase [Halomonas utahensis]MYL74630.1 alpha/beta fold hydrolase [Halomonas sp. 22501_18_FS]
MPNTEPEQLTLDVPAGTLGALAWGDTSSPLVIAFHGWLDNAASFNRLGPALADDYRVVAVDLPGHGFSYHRPPGASYELLDYVRDLAPLFDREASQGAVLLGHSLGGIVASLLSVAVPERVRALMLVDSLGPLTGDAESFPDQLKQAIDRVRQGSRGQPPRYADVEEAIVARMKGRIPLSRVAAECIVPRSLQQDQQGWRWGTDARLRYPSMHRLEEDEVEAYLAAIAAPTLLIRANRGMAAFKPEWIEGRLPRLSDAEVIDVEGSHHCHLDGDVGGLAEGCLGWLGRIRSAPL